MTYTPNAAEMDGLIWAQGYSRWLTAPFNPTTKRPHELDYLRGIHNSPTLTALGRWLSGALGRNVRLRSMWQDKHVYVKPLDAAGAELERRELADLAVIVNRIDMAGIQRSMWILQAKVASRPSSRLTGPSTDKEIALFEQTDCFTLLDGSGADAGRSYYAFEFSGPQNWAFLTFHKNHRVPMKKGDPFPVMMRWPGSTSPKKPTVDSLCRSLLEVCKGNLGASVDHPPEDDEWSRLFRALMDDEKARPTTGYAVTAGNALGSVLQLAATALPGFNRFVLEHYSHDRNRYHELRRRVELVRSANLWPSPKPWPDPPGALVCRGFWGSGVRPDNVDRRLLEQAFGESPPTRNDGDRRDRGQGEGPGIPHILFVDLWGEPTRR